MRYPERFSEMNENLCLLLSHTRGIAVAPRGFDEHATRFSIARFGNPSATGVSTTGMFGGTNPKYPIRSLGDSNRLRSPVVATKVTAERRSIPRKPRSASTSGLRDHLVVVSLILFIRASLLSFAVQTVST